MLFLNMVCLTVALTFALGDGVAVKDSDRRSAAYNARAGSDAVEAGVGETKAVGHGVYKGVEDSRRKPALWAGHTRNSRKAVLGDGPPAWRRRVGHSGPRSGDTLESPWIPLPFRPWVK
jgi:hypothetical protein